MPASARANRVAQAVLLRPELAGRIGGGEFLGLIHLADLDLLVDERGALDPLDALFLGLRLQQPESPNQLLRLRERTVDHGLLAAAELDAHALRARVQPLARQHDARLDELLVELAHRREHLLVAWLDAGLGLLRRLHDHHESHRRSPCRGLVLTSNQATNGTTPDRHPPHAFFASPKPLIPWRFSPPAPGTGRRGTVAP